MTMIIIGFASLVALAAAGACFWIVRRITGSRPSARDLDTWIDINWQSTRPIERLLDPSEFEFLRRRGMCKQRIEELRAKRRGLFRMYLRRITLEFNATDRALRQALVDAHIDRPDLARELGRQRLLFYRGVLTVELHLALNWLGFSTMPTLDLIRPLERLHLEFCNLGPAAAGAQA